MAAEGGGIGDLFVALGLDWRSLLLNAVAFLVIVWLLGKYVYPVLLKTLDAKRGELEAAARSQQEASEALAKAEQSAAKIVAEARDSARELTGAAKQEAADIVKAAETRATEQAERITAQAREQLARDVEAARRELKAETARLVVAATERVTGERLDSDRDAALIQRSLGEGH